MHRVFIDRESITNGIVKITGEDSKHISKVLRLHEGDIIELCDGQGQDYEGVIKRIYGTCVEVDIEKSFPSYGEPQTEGSSVSGRTQGCKDGYNYSKMC